ncbi:hypothetical protein LTR36_010616 [Oleoguttula mirabilis]|uniref:Uncharacterized protein n=1 Tax=Oleoguttula mirabilis TaxID=1507867 RepID=A0AAV9JSB3_9PEZI|nr:hypothetical protein LTR36_010616 [Oleoguttula mirabilis]
MDFVPLLPGATQDDPPRVRLDDYYASLQTQEQSTSTTENYTLATAPRVRLDDIDYYATLQAQEQDEVMTEGETEASDETDDVELDQAPPPSKKQHKHKPMSAEEQVQAIEALQARLATFPQQQQQQQQAPKPSSPPPDAQETPVKAGRKRKTSEVVEVVDDEARPKARTDRRRKSQQTEKPKSQQTKSFSYKAAKDIANNIRPEIEDIINRMQRLGKPFNEDVENIVSMAGMVLDGQAEVDGPMLQLFRIGDEWKQTHSRYRTAMVAFLERYGVVPMGSAS